MSRLFRILTVILTAVMVLSLWSTAVFADSDPSSKLIAEYNFDDENTKDSVGINHAILYNGKAPTDDGKYVDGVVGKALQLSQKGSIKLLWLSIPYEVFDDDPDSFSISMWYKATGYNTTGEDSELFSFYNTSIENFMFYSPAAVDFQNKAYVMRWSGLDQSYGYANIITPYNPDNWVHVVFCVDAVDGQSVITAYINGKTILVDQGGNWENSLISAMGIDNFTIGGKNPYKGGDTPSCLFFGCVDEVQIYSGALSYEEAVSIYNSAGYDAPDAPAPTQPASQPQSEAPSTAAPTTEAPQTDAPTEAVPDTEASETNTGSEAAEAEAPESSGGGISDYLGWIVAGIAIVCMAVMLVMFKKKTEKK